MSQTSHTWDPERYLTYADERGRPFVDLVGRIDADAPRVVVDLGCGPGNLTRLLKERWPDARVSGVDSSPEMIEAASAIEDVTWEVGDVSAWATPDPLALRAPVDVLVSNATLQWIPEHLDLLPGLLDRVAPGGWFAFQVPGNFGAPSHTLMRDLAASPRWRDRLSGVLRHEDAVLPPEGYLDRLAALGCAVDAWETTYVHLLTGEDPVLDWVKGTGLRPVLTALDDDPAAREEFLAEYRAALREAYPATAHGTPFRFRRVFAVAVREA